MSRTTLWRVLAVGLPMLAALAASLPSVDLAFQLRAGSEILAAGAIPTVDSWTFTAAGQPWLDQQWGSQVLLQLVFGAAAWTGLALLRAALVGLAFGLLFATVRRRAPGLGSIGSTVLVIAAFVVSADALALRAQLFAIVLFAATLYILAIRVERPRAVWLIPVIAAVWANLHGTFLFVPALCGLAWLADLYELAASPAGEVQRRARDVHRMLIVGLVATAATLVNPFGPAVWGYVANLTSNPTIASRVTEWQPPSPTTVPGALVWLSVLGVAALALVRVRRVWRSRDAASPHWSGAFRSKVHIPWPGLLTLVLFGGFALASGRGTAWWPFAAVFVIAPWLVPNRAGVAAVEAPPPEPLPTPRTFRRVNALMVAILVLVAIALLPVWRPIGAAGVPEGTLSYAPQGIANALQRAAADRFGRPAGVWNPQVWGSWFEYAAPGNRYTLDSRIELFNASLWGDEDTVATGSPGWDTILDRYLVDEVVTNRATDQALEAVLAASGQWTLRYADCDGSVWGRPTISFGGSGGAVGPVTEPTCP
jgi:hypothetical protein